MEGVHVVGVGQEAWGTEVPQWGPEVEAKCENRVQFLTFCGTKIRINEYRSRAWTVLRQ